MASIKKRKVKKKRREVKKDLYTFAFSFHPVIAILDAPTVAAPARITIAPQSCAPRYFPSDLSIIAPAVGGPASAANPSRVATMPNRVPIFLGSAVKLVKAPPNTPCAAPLDRPKKTQKT